MGMSPKDKLTAVRRVKKRPPSPGSDDGIIISDSRFTMLDDGDDEGEVGDWGAGDEELVVCTYIIAPRARIFGLFSTF